MKAKTNAQPPTPARELTFIADSRLAELRRLGAAQFDLRKLIRLCEEINIAYSQECYFATAMLTRGLLDHVPPLFQKNSFTEVTNNYGGGGKSFKETMHHLENATQRLRTPTCTRPYARARRCLRHNKSTAPSNSTCCSPRLCG